MTIASPSNFVVADIKWLLREFQRFPSMARKIFGGKISCNSNLSAAVAGHDKMIVAARDKKLEAARENRKLKRPTTTRLYSLTSRHQGHSR